MIALTPRSTHFLFHSFAYGKAGVQLFLRILVRTGSPATLTDTQHSRDTPSPAPTTSTDAMTSGPRDDRAASNPFKNPSPHRSPAGGLR